jgi:hypothetical protein
MAQQYRHIIPANPESLICNHNLFDLSAPGLTEQERVLLVAILNSTLVGLFKTFYGRYAGTEGNLKTEVIDVNLIEVPDPRRAPKRAARRVVKAFKKLCEREIGGLVEESLRECHTYQRALELAKRPITLPDELQRSDRRELDDAVFELLGLTDVEKRSPWICRLYEQTVLHFRDVRVTEIQKMEDRRSGGSTRFAIDDQAADAWDALELPNLVPLAEWVAAHATGDCEVVSIPAERPVHLARSAIFDNETVYFGKSRREYMVCQSRGEAELVARMAELGVSGEVSVPVADQTAKKVRQLLDDHHEKVAARLRELAVSRSTDPKTQEDVFRLLERWFVLGRPSQASPRRASSSRS